MTQLGNLARLLACCSALSLGVLGCDKTPPPPPAQGGQRLATADGGFVTKLAPPPGTKPAFFKFGPPDSKIGFVGAKVTAKHEGSFRSFEGTIGLVQNDPLLSAVQLSIDMASLTIAPDDLATHLKSPDLLDVAKFPKAAFNSTTIRPGSSPTAFNVTGKLNLHGVTKPLTFPATIRVSAGAVDAEAELTINRKDFGIVYPGMPDDLISDDVKLTFAIHAVPGNPESTPPEERSPAGAHSAN